MEILTPFQRQVVKIFSREPLFKDFFLAGGAALSVFYLKHRFSDDLDFFTEADGLVPQIFPRLDTALKKEGIKLEAKRRFETFIEAYASKRKETVKIDLAQDAPFRLKPAVFQKSLGIAVDNKLDIACNKFSALFDRHDTKDFVDIYFLCQEGHFTFDKLYQYAKEKHIGLDDYWLAVSLRFVEEIEKLPRMIKPLEIETLKSFFRNQLERLTPSFRGNPA